MRIDARLRDKLAVARRTIGIAGQILPSPTAPATHDSGIAEREGAIQRRLRAWLCAGDVEQIEGDAAAAVRGEHPGFLALVENDQPQLVACVRWAISTAAADILEALDMAEGPPVEIDAESLDQARRAVDRWLEHARAASAVDFATAASMRVRRSTLAKVEQALATAPRHRRVQMAALAEAARSVVTSPLSEGAERVLAALACAEQPDEVWLRSVAAFGELHARAPAARNAAHRVLAIILFQPGRSRG
jgi:hypothetical protein